MERGKATSEVRRIRVCTAVQQAADDVVSRVLRGVVQRRHLVRVCSFETDAVPQSLQHTLQVSPRRGGKKFLLVGSRRPAVRWSSRLSPQEKVSARVKPHRSVLPHAVPDARVASEQRTRATQRFFVGVCPFPNFTVDVSQKICRLWAVSSTHCCVIITHVFTVCFRLQNARSSKLLYAVHFLRENHTRALIAHAHFVPQ